jgi:hypothetical protein
MIEHADLKKHALSLLELSKRFLVEDGTLDPTSIIERFALAFLNGKSRNESRPRGRVHRKRGR